MDNNYEAAVSDTMSEKFIKYKYITAGGKENGRNGDVRESKWLMRRNTHEGF